MKFKVNNKEVFASTGGRPFDKSKPLIIFIHGSGLSHITWVLQTRYFAFHGYSVLAIDLPGHGYSEGPALESIEEQGKWISDVIEHLESQEVDILLRVEIEGSDKVDVLRYTDLSVQLTQCRFILDDDIDLINMGAMLKGMDPIPFEDNTFVTLTYESSYSGSYKASSPVLVEGYENTFDVFSLLEQTKRKFKAISKL